MHASDPRFLVTCDIEGCTVSSKSFSSLYSHIYRRHSNVGIVKKRIFQLQPDDQSSSELNPSYFSASLNDEGSDEGI